MQFNVPQFIDIEDKIIGPLTLKQFLFLVAGAGLLFGLWLFLNLGSFIILAIPVVIFFGALAFYRPHGRSFISLVGSWIKYISKPRLYLWKRERKK